MHQPAPASTIPTATQPTQHPQPICLPIGILSVEVFSSGSDGDFGSFGGKGTISLGMQLRIEM